MNWTRNIFLFGSPTPDSVDFICIHSNKTNKWVHVLYRSLKCIWVVQFKVELNITFIIFVWSSTSTFDLSFIQLTFSKYSLDPSGVGFIWNTKKPFRNDKVQSKCLGFSGSNLKSLRLFTVGDFGVQLAGQTSPWLSTNWKAFTRRSVSSTERPTGRSLMLMCLTTPFGSMINSPLHEDGFGY